MSGEGRDLMEVNGDSLAVEERRTLQGETIPPVQTDFGDDGLGEPVFLQAEEEITVHRSVQAMRGDMIPIAQEQAQLRQDVQDLASEAANVLYHTAVRSEQSVAGLRQETGHALSQAESAIGQVGSSVQSLDAQVQQMSSEQQLVLERAQRAEWRTEQLMQDLQESRRVQEEIQSALEEQKAAYAQQNLFIERDQTGHEAKLASFEQALESVRRDRDSMRTEVQTLSTQLTEALNQVENLTFELGQTRRLIPSVPSPNPPVVPHIIPPVSIPTSSVVSSIPMGVPTGQTRQPYIPASVLADTRTDPVLQDHTTTLETFAIPPPHVQTDRSAWWRIPEEDASERMSTYLEDQSSIAGFSMEVLGESLNDVRTSEWVSEHASIASSRRSGSAAVSPPLGRIDCGRPEGCGTEGSPVRFKIDLKPKDPPVFAGKGTEDVDIWVKQVSNFLTIIGGPDHIQVAYVANLLQGAAQHWFQRECDAGRHPRTWRELGQALRHRFGNDTKTEQAQSHIMAMQQGKNESAHDYALRFETVLEKIPCYDESWVRNLFVWGLHSHLATQVNMQNPATLNRAIQLAKRADVAVQLSRRPGAGGSGSTQQKTKAAGSKPNIVMTTGPTGAVFFKISKNKNQIKIGLTGVPIPEEPHGVVIDRR